MMKMFSCGKILIYNLYSGHKSLKTLKIFLLKRFVIHILTDRYFFYCYWNNFPISFLNTSRTPIIVRKAAGEKCSRNLNFERKMIKKIRTYISTYEQRFESLENCKISRAKSYYPTHILTNGLVFEIF